MAGHPVRSGDGGGRKCSGWFTGEGAGGMVEVVKEEVFLGGCEGVDVIEHFEEVFVWREDFGGWRACCCR